MQKPLVLGCKMWLDLSHFLHIVDKHLFSAVKVKGFCGQKQRSGQQKPPCFIGSNVCEAEKSKRALF
jgi:hypothetical protein